MFMLFVGLIALAYEQSRSYALERQRIALQEKEQANIRLQQSGDAKSRFLANMSHGVLSLLFQFCLLSALLYPPNHNFICLSRASYSIAWNHCNVQGAVRGEPNSAF